MLESTIFAFCISSFALINLPEFSLQLKKFLDSTARWMNQSDTGVHTGEIQPEAQRGKLLRSIDSAL